MKLGTRWPARPEDQGLGVQSVGGAARSRLCGEDLRVDSLAAPAAVVREDAVDNALRGGLGCVRTYDDTVTLLQERVETRQLAAD